MSNFLGPPPLFGARTRSVVIVSRAEAIAPDRDSVRAPLLQAVRRSRRGASFQKRPPTRGMDRATLLLVEDDPLIRSFLADNLTADGYELLVCGTMRDALRALEYHRPDLAVVDLKLPDGSGLDLIRRVRDADGVGSRLDPTLPLVILTGCAGEVDRVRGFELGADDYVSKPFGYPELRGLLSGRWFQVDRAYQHNHRSWLCRQTRLLPGAVSATFVRRACRRSIDRRVGS